MFDVELSDEWKNSLAKQGRFGIQLIMESGNWSETSISWLDPIDDFTTDPGKARRWNSFEDADKYKSEIEEYGPWKTLTSTLLAGTCDQFDLVVADLPLAENRDG